jgi:hypothetical protein
MAPSGFRAAGSTTPPSSAFDSLMATREFSAQWTHPGDVFSVLLILGGDVVNRALAQLAGGWLTPVTFSFGMPTPMLKLSQALLPLSLPKPKPNAKPLHRVLGWVAYAVTALVCSVGENRLMPSTPDCAVIVINGKNGYLRVNSSWIIGRLVRDFEHWMSDTTRRKVHEIIEAKHADLRKKAEPGKIVAKPSQAGLCVTVYRASAGQTAGVPKKDRIYWSGIFTAVIQLGIAAIPCGIYGDWGILLITASGIALAFATGSLPQWSKEKWACRRESDKTVILTRGNGSQHAIVIVGDGHGLDLEDLAAGNFNDEMLTSSITRLALVTLATLWILLLISASGEHANTWFLLAVGGIGALQNVAVAGWRRRPSAFGVHLTPEPESVIGSDSVMKALYYVEEQYPHVGRSMRETFFPGKLWPKEVERWDEYEKEAEKHDQEQKRLKKAAEGGKHGHQDVG